MPRDDHFDDGPDPRHVPLPDDRVWRHPSELGPVAAPARAGAPHGPGRVGAVQGVLAGAALVGVVLTVGTLLLTRNNSVAERRAGPPAGPQLAATSLTGPISFIGVPRRKLGLRAADPDPAVVRASGYAGGAVVSAVEDDSEARAVGLEVGDLVVAVDGEAVVDAQGLADLVAERPSGTTAVFDVIHDGRIVHVTVLIP